MNSSTSNFDPAALAGGSDPSGRHALPATGGIVSARPPRTHSTLLPRKRASARACMAAFLVTSGVLLTISLVTKRLNLWPAQPVPTVATLPKDPDYYLAYSLGGIEDYMVYHGFNGIPARLKAADILFLGNSHMQFSFPRQTLAPFFEARHMHYYQLGFGYVETSAFGLAIIQKFDLHPKYVVCNIEPFFSTTPSGMSQIAMRESMFDGVKFRIETAGAFYAERYVHQIIPALAQQFPPGDEAYFRSARDGNIWLAASAHLHRPPEAITPEWQSAISAARAFKAVMDRRGIKMIFTHSPVVTGVAARGLSEALGGVPIIEADPLRDLFTFDGSHLEHDSAVRFSQSFLNHLAPVLDGQTKKH